MAFHDRNKDGVMRQETIITVLTEGATTQQDHDLKVNMFNEKHVVFYNASSACVVDGKLTLITTCLYADKSTTYINNVVEETLPSGTKITVNKFKKVIKQ